MSFPTNAKTWQVKANQTVSLQASIEVTAQMCIFTLKNVLKSFSTNPWTCYYSCNAGKTISGGVNYGAAGTAGDGVDRWAIANQTLTQSGGVITVPNDVNSQLGGIGTPHSWIVLKQAGFGGANGFQLCLDCSSVSGINVGASIVGSFGAGFTGGTINARPTATDEISFINNAPWYSSAQAQHQIHAWQSTDGKCTRVVMYRGTTNMCCFWHFDEAQNPVSGWTNKALAAAFHATSGFSNTYSLLGGAQNYTCFGAGGIFSAGLSFETFNGQAGGLCQATGIGTAVNTFSSLWPAMPVGLCASSPFNAGRLGQVADLYWKPTGLSDGDSFPNNAATKNFIVLGNLVFPWTGDGTTPLLT